jgi:UDP-N-acetylmuramate dehydrogenase
MDISRFDFLSQKATVLKDEPMKNHTSFKIGGAADILIEAACEEDIRATILFVRENKIPLTVIGSGTNLLVRDGGIRGVVLKTAGGLTEIEKIGPNIIKIGSGQSMTRAAIFARDNSLSGFEFAHGIPGTVGGGVFMNAGAYDGEMKDVVKSTRFLTMDGEEKSVHDDDHRFGYRKSMFSDGKYVILSTVIELMEGEKVSITAKMDDLKKRRTDKQPLDMPSAGSIFKRPPDDYAGRLIDVCGFRGKKVGGAEVSSKHCGFIVNSGGASAKDVINLIELIKEEVYKRFKKELTCELRIIGED